MPAGSQSYRRTAPSRPDGVGSWEGQQEPLWAFSLIAGHPPTVDEPAADPRAVSRPRSTGDMPERPDSGSVDHSGRYLVAAAVFTLVALTGAVLMVATRHDAVGMALLLSGDALTVIIWVVYLRHPSGSGRPGALTIPLVQPPYLEGDGPVAGCPDQGEDAPNGMAETRRRHSEKENGPIGHGPGDGRVQLSMVIEHRGGMDG